MSTNWQAPYVYREPITGRAWTLYQRYTSLKRGAEPSAGIITYFFARVEKIPRSGEPAQLPDGYIVIPIGTRFTHRRVRAADGTYYNKPTNSRRRSRMPMLRREASLDLPTIGDRHPGFFKPPSPIRIIKKMVTCGKCMQCRNGGKHGPYDYRVDYVAKNGKRVKKLTRINKPKKKTKKLKKNAGKTRTR